ncbi:hypothetical protein D9M70_246190 [compost metagenome]
MPGFFLRAGSPSEAAYATCRSAPCARFAGMARSYRIFGARSGQRETFPGHPVRNFPAQTKLVSSAAFFRPKEKRALPCGLCFAFFGRT